MSHPLNTQPEELCHQVEELRDKVSRLHGIREDEREMDRIFSETQQLEDPQTPAAVETQTAPIPTIMVSATSGEGEGWQLVPSGTKRKAPAPPKGLQLQNRFTTLKAEEEPDMLSSRSCGSPDPKSCKTPRRKLQVTVVGHSLLLGTEASICPPDGSSRDTCSLLGTWIWGVVERL